MAHYGAIGDTLVVNDRQLCFQHPFGTKPEGPESR